MKKVINKFINCIDFYYLEKMVHNKQTTKNKQTLYDDIQQVQVL